MRPFAYRRAERIADAFDPTTMPIAGGTDLFNLMKEGIAGPTSLIDISCLPEAEITPGPDGDVEIGALATLADIGRHSLIRARYPALAEAIELSASPQIRAVATIGGNLLQQTRCPYYRAETELPCNRRQPGSGCSALGGEDRTAAIFGWVEACIATHPSDAAVALTAFDARLALESASGPSILPIQELHANPSSSAPTASTLEPGQIIRSVNVPQPFGRSAYVKVRERHSYDFALVSAAVNAEVDADGRVCAARVALGGVAFKPWRLLIGEARLKGVSIGDRAALRSALSPAFADARPGRQNGFKIELALRAVIAALEKL